jgi:hypothetical protein
MSSKARQLADLGNQVDDGAITGTNIIVNGAMTVAQRGTSATGGGYMLDRFSLAGGGTINDVTQSQAALTSSDAPYEHGFRYAWKLLNGTATNNSNDYVEPIYKFENQDVQQSGWDVTSSSSYVTLSFWVKSSLAGTYYVRFLCTEGSSSGWKSYVEPFTVSSNTWKKVVITLTGGAQNFPITNEGDFRLNINVHYGTNYTSSSATTSAWHSYIGPAEYPDFQQNWKNTVNSTFYLTGVCLNVGDSAIDFPHENYGETLAKCQRYFYRYTGASDDRWGVSYSNSNNTTSTSVSFPVTMRSTPTGVVSSNGLLRVRNLADGLGGDITPSTLSCLAATKDRWKITVNAQLSNAAQILAFATKLDFDAEL